MAVKLNLLPEDFALTGPLGQIIKFLRPLNTILLTLFLIMAVGMGGFFIFSSILLKNLTAGNVDLENQIQKQSSAQQQIVLLKDRLAQIKTVQKFPEATKNLDNIDPLLALVSGNSLLSELDVDAQKVTASIIFKSSSDLTNFLEKVNSSTGYSSVSLGTFNYSPAAGYQIGLTLVGK